MENINIYESIGKRTGGDIYIGVSLARKGWKIHIYKEIHGAYGAAGRNGRL